MEERTISMKTLETIQAFKLEELIKVPLIYSEHSVILGGRRRLDRVVESVWLLLEVVFCQLLRRLRWKLEVVHRRQLQRDLVWEKLSRGGRVAEVESLRRNRHVRSLISTVFNPRL